MNSLKNSDSEISIGAYRTGFWVAADGFADLQKWAEFIN